MDARGEQARGAMLQVAHAFDIAGAKSRLADKGGYEIVHSSPGLEIGVYVLVAPEPDHQQPHADDEVYVVLEGQGALEVEGEGRGVARGRSDLRAGRRTARLRRLRAAERARDLREGTTLTAAEQPLPPEELELIDAYWRAANYLSVGQIYLLDNPLAPTSRSRPST